uniref:tyrosine-type recombinase/integrase n=1 Tax=Blastomonas sp. TaxID=1909299 RepID=UPI0035945D8A
MQDHKGSFDALSPCDDTAYLWDTEIVGFGLKLTPTGHRSYLLQYRPGGRGTPTRRIKIGDHGELTPDQARKTAKALRAQVTLGIDPAETKRAERQAAADVRSAAAEAERLAKTLLVSTLVDDWINALRAASDATGKPRPRTVQFYASTARKHVVPKIGDKSLPDVTKADFKAMLKDVPVGSQALRRNVYATVSALCTWARHDAELIAIDPLEGVKAPKAVTARDTVLSDDEVYVVWQAAHGLRPVHRVFYRLLILTGQRREEVAGLQWPELDRAAMLWTLPAGRAKNGEKHLVPLSPMAVAQLDVIGGTKWPRSGPVLSLDGKRSIAGFSKLRKELDAEIVAVMADMPDAPELKPWRLHDLRRTLATGLQALGARFEVTESVLNHVSGSKAGVAGIYQRHDWAVEKREALNAWADKISALVAMRSGDNVIP